MTGAEAAGAGCPCCGAEPDAPWSGSYHLCPLCGWQDDPVQAADPACEGGANGVSLDQARANFRTFGAIDPAGSWGEPRDRLP
ncbi:MAG: CPCC family cysteine-rich protein [Pseudomonadota bacterium]